MSSRGHLVAKVMKESGMSLPEASHYVKKEGLYKGGVVVGAAMVGGVVLGAGKRKHKRKKHVRR